jgi:hypothetical protein
MEIALRVVSWQVQELQHISALKRSPFWDPFVAPLARLLPERERLVQKVTLKLATAPSFVDRSPQIKLSLLRTFALPKDHHIVVPG